MHKTEGQRFTPPSRAQLLADLRWLLLSEPLLCEDLYPGQVQRFSSDQNIAIAHWLKQLPIERPELSAVNFEMESYQRLGRYAEKLLKFFLLNFSEPTSKPYQLLAHNLALNSNISGSSTQGEIDFLVIDSEQQPRHWEMAVKFFACEPLSHRADAATALSSEIIGPNRRDRLSLKIAKLFERQMRHIAPTPFEHFAWQAQAFAKGRIYYRLGEEPPTHSLHEGRALLNPKHERGFWCLSNELHLIDERHPATSLYPLYRSEWLSPKSAETLDWERHCLDIHRNLMSSDNENTRERIDKSRLPLMVAVMRDNIEVGRGFILPQDHLLKPITLLS
jgi:hypothetical protein